MKVSGNEQKSSKFRNDATYGNTMVVPKEWGTYQKRKHFKFVSVWQFKKMSLGSILNYLTGYKYLIIWAWINVSTCTRGLRAIFQGGGDNICCAHQHAQEVCAGGGGGGGVIFAVCVGRTPLCPNKYRGVTIAPYHQISWSLEAARLEVILIVSRWNVTGMSAALLPRCPPDSRVIEKV